MCLLPMIDACHRCSYACKTDGSNSPEGMTLYQSYMTFVRLASHEQAISSPMIMILFLLSLSISLIKVAKFLEFSHRIA